MAEVLSDVRPQGADLAMEMVGLQQQIDRLQLRLSQTAAAFDRSEYWDFEGFNSALDWMRFNCHLTSTAAADRLAVGHRLHQLTESSQAMEKGEIGFAHLTVMARTAAAVGQAFDENKLLQLAKENSPGRFHYKCMHFRHAVDSMRYAERSGEDVRRSPAAPEHRRRRLAPDL